jgi:hypothetical protein
MSNITLFGGNAVVPAFARNAALSETTMALVGGGLGGKRISIKGGVFRLVSAGKEVAQIEDRHLDVIVVKAAPKVARVFYAKKYDSESTPSAPDCWSNDGERPDNSIKAPQNSACHNCPQNIAGSGQGNSRACRYQQRLAVLVADDQEAGVHQIVLPATSIFGKEEGGNMPLQAYARTLAAQTNPVDVGMVVTRMKFDTKAESPKLFFKAMRWLSEEEYGFAQEAAISPEANAAIKMTAAQQDGVKPPVDEKEAIVELQGQRPAAKAKPEVEEAEEEAPVKPARKTVARKTTKEELVQEPATVGGEAEEPEVRKPVAKASDAVAPKGKLSDIVGKWDDED